MREGKIAVARFLAGEAQELARAYGDVYEVAAADRVLAEVEAAEGRRPAALSRIALARQVLDRLGETYERARLDLLRLRLEHRIEPISLESLRERALEASRPYRDHPDSPVMSEVGRLLGGGAETAFHPN
jgi:hypothetical protein